MIRTLMRLTVGIGIVGNIPVVSHAQMQRALLNLPVNRNTIAQSVWEFSDEEKMKLLATVVGDSVQFLTLDYQNDQTAENKYFPLNMSGLRFLDLDEDEDLDLLYTGLSGNMGMQDTKVYIRSDKGLEYAKTLKGEVINIHYKSGIQVDTYWQPCCDSYTSRWESYTFDKDSLGTLVHSISFIGRSPYFREMPYFEMLEEVRLSKVKLVALKEDFKGVGGYFRDRNKEIKTKLEKHSGAVFLEMDVSVNARIIGNKTVKGRDLYLVITDPINEVPKYPENLYEWSEGDNRRFIGWTSTSLAQ